MHPLSHQSGINAGSQVLCKASQNPLDQHPTANSPSNYERHDLDRNLGRHARDLRAILADLDQMRALLTYIGRTRCLKDLGDMSLMKNAP